MFFIKGRCVFELKESYGKIDLLLRAEIREKILQLICRSQGCMLKNSGFDFGKGEQSRIAIKKREEKTE